MQIVAVNDACRKRATAVASREAATPRFGPRVFQLKVPAGWNMTTNNLVTLPADDCIRRSITVRTLQHNFYTSLKGSTRNLTVIVTPIRSSSSSLRRGSIRRYRLLVNCA